jgi:hypothetical protein
MVGGDAAKIASRCFSSKFREIWCLFCQSGKSFKKKYLYYRQILLNPLKMLLR